MRAISSAATCGSWSATTDSRSGQVGARLPIWSNVKQSARYDAQSADDEPLTRWRTKSLGSFHPRKWLLHFMKLQERLPTTKGQRGK